MIQTFIVIFESLRVQLKVVASLLAPDRRVLWYQLWDRKPCWCFDWMLQSSFALIKTEAFCWNVGKAFRSQSWYQRTAFSLMVKGMTTTRHG